MENNSLIVKYKKENEIILVNDIVAIQRGIGGINFNGKMSVCYTISFSEKYGFGNKIYLRYRADEVTRQFIEKDPEEIVDLKRNISKKTIL